ncbi:MAG TPA: hypothetical protein VF725_02950 [Ktedonobacterales bacterium]|jgi:hypothetical protein
MAQTLVVYEALLASEQSLARVRNVSRAIERTGGRVEIERQAGSAAHIVTVWLPPQHRIEDALPGLPFYPV